MRCPACGSETSTSGDCPRCGAKAPVPCPECGFANPSLANFCAGCGRPIGLPPTDPERIASVESYTPRHLAERILSVRDAVQGERKRVTVMFADVRGSFELIEGADPERIQAMLDEVVRLMTEAVHRYEGTVAQILGDGIMALFGAPIAHEDHAVRAAYAALAMHEAAREVAIDSELPIRPQIRVGLDSGEVVIGAIGNDLSVDYRAVGPTTYMASRMEQIALPGTTRITGETYRLTGGMIQAQPLGPAVIKGVSHPVETYEVTGRMAVTRFQAQIARGLSPFVGRDAELSALSAAFADAIAGTARIAIVEGEPGIGKSRLCYELLRQVPAPDSRVIEVSAMSYGRAPFAMLRAVLRAQLEIGPDDAAPVIQSKLDSELERLAPLAPLRPALANILDLPVEDVEWRSLDPALRRQRSFEAIRALISRLSEQRLLILLLEDLHWFDNESLAFIEDLLREPPVGMLFLLFTHRPEFHHEWANPSAFHLCHLDPLSRESSLALIASLVGGHSALEVVRQELLERTYGNPFFIEESVRALAETRVLIGKPSAYRLADPGPSIDIPPSVESLIAARIDALPNRLKELLRAATVIGEEMLPDLLQSVLGLPEQEFRARMDAAKEMGILFEAEFFPTSVCRFRHSLIREVIYRGLLSSQRRDLHARAVAALESRFADRTEEHLDLLASHSYEGQLWEKSVHYHLRACARAATRWANRDAVAHLDSGLESLAHLAPSDDATRAGIDLRLSGLAPLLPLGNQERMVKLLREAEQMAESIGDHRRLGAVYSQLATALWMASEHERALEAAEKALALAQQESGFALRKAALNNMGMVHHARADFSRAIEIFGGLVDEFGGALERKRFGWAGYPSVLCRTFLASSHTLTGDFGEAIRHFADGVRIADELDHPYSRAIVREELAYCYLCMGEPQAALGVLETAMQISQRNDVHTMYPAICGRLAIALSQAGRAVDAIDLAEDALARGTHQLGGRYALHFLLLGLGTAYLRAGRAKDALVPARRVEALTAAAHENAYHACSLVLLGEVHADQGGESAEAERAFESALEIAAEHRLRPITASCRQALGELYAKSGRPADAAQQLRVAGLAWRELGLAQRAADTDRLLERVAGDAG